MIQNILRDTKHILEQHGWIQESYGNPETGYCLEGALDCAIASVDLSSDRISGAEMVHPFMRMAIEEITGLPTLLSHRGWNLVLWNDDPLRTYEEVIKVLDLAYELVD